MSVKEGSSINEFLREVRLNGSMFLAAFLIALGFPFTYYFDVTDWRLASGPAMEVAGTLSVMPRTLMLLVRDENEARSFELLCGNEQIRKVNEPCFPSVDDFDGAEVRATVQAAGKGQLKLIDLSVEGDGRLVVNREFFEKRYSKNLARYVEASVVCYLGISVFMVFILFLKTRKLK